MKDPDDGLSKLAKSTRAAAPLLNAVWRLIGSVFLLVGVGYGVDRYQGTGPYGLLVGGLLGSAVGLYSLIHAANTLMQSDAKKKKP